MNSQTWLRQSRQPDEGQADKVESSSHVIEAIHQAIEWAALGIEVLAVAVIVAGVGLVAIRRGTVRYLFHLRERGAVESYKQQLGKPLLLGLELLVAADVIRTVALEPTLANIAVLGLLVIVRTLLSWSLAVEMEGHWPWQGRAGTPSQTLCAGKND